MPDNDWNLRQWGNDYDWQRGGEEWSGVWGTSEAQWYGTILPRLHRFLPARNVLELAPGYGRWTEYLLENCSHYDGIDYAEQCVAACKTRFKGRENAFFHKNNGKNIDIGIEDGYDLIFCFDSFVHIEIDVLTGYISQCIEKLALDGIAFIHHSNLGEYGGSIGLPHSRAPSVSAKDVSAHVAKAGGRVVCQELVNWNQPELIDCLTLFSRNDAKWRGSSDPVRNGDFMMEASFVRSYQRRYCV